MKKKHKLRLARTIREKLPGLLQLGDLLVLGPVSRLLRGFSLEDSSTPSQCYVWAFIQPLYVPATRSSFNLGQRVGGSSRSWGLDESDRLAEAAAEACDAILGEVESPGDLVRWLSSRDRTGPHAQQAVAYSLIAAGKFAEGAVALRDFVSALATDDRDWVVRMRLRAEELADKAETAPAAAASLLKKWEDETTKSLGLHLLAEQRP